MIHQCNSFFTAPRLPGHTDYPKHITVRGCRICGVSAYGSPYGVLTIRLLFYTAPKWPVKPLCCPRTKNCLGNLAHPDRDWVSQETFRSLITPMRWYRLHPRGWQPPNYHDLWGKDSPILDTPSFENLYTSIVTR